MSIFMVIVNISMYYFNATRQDNSHGSLSSICRLKSNCNYYTLLLGFMGSGLSGLLDRACFYRHEILFNWCVF